MTETIESTSPAERTRTLLGILRAVLAALGSLALGVVVGGLVGIVVVDETDANASHSSVDIAIVGLLATLGLLLAARGLIRSHRRHDEPR